MILQKQNLHMICLFTEMRRAAVFLAALGKIMAATVSEFNPEVNSVMPPPPKKVNMALRSLQCIRMCSLLKSWSIFEDFLNEQSSLKFYLPDWGCPGEPIWNGAFKVPPFMWHALQWRENQRQIVQLAFFNTECWYLPDHWIDYKDTINSLQNELI